jgi:hypothetical protein
VVALPATAAVVPLVVGLAAADTICGGGVLGR